MAKPCDYCKNGPIEDCPFMFDCPAEWEEDDGCTDCAIELEVSEDD